MGPPGGKSESGVNLKRGLCAPFQAQTPSSKTPPDSQWLCQSQQKSLPEGGGSKPLGQKDSRDGEGSSISSLFQQTFHSSQTKSKIATSLGPQCSKQIFECKNIQNGNPRDNSDLLTTRGMGDIAGFQQCLFPHSYSHRVSKISQVPLPKPVLPVAGLPLWPFNSSNGVHLCGQRGQVNGSIQGYKDPPVPRRLVDSSPHQRILHPISPRPLSRVVLGGEPSKVRVGTQTGVRVRGLQVQSLSQPGQADPEPFGVNSSKGGLHFSQSHLSSQEVHVPDRPSHCNRETGPTGDTSHDTNSVASQETLDGSIVSREGDSSSKVLSPASSMVDQGEKCLNRPTPGPLAIQILTDASKEGWRAH